MSCSPPYVPEYGMVRDTFRTNLSASVPGPGAIGVGGDWLIANSLPTKTEMSRQGQLWDVRIASASAFTHVAALPTTRAELLLYNGEPTSGGKVYVIDTIWSLAISSMAAAGSVALIAQFAPGIAAPTDDTAQLITGRSGKTYGANAKRAVAQTTMTANKWTLLAMSQSGGSATAQIGLAALADVYGSYILRPGDTLGVNLVAGTAAGTSIMGISWYEVQLNYA
jgi:hypothetical protein